MKIFMFLICFLASTTGFAQNIPNSLKDYKYIIIDFKIYPNGNKDIYQIGNYIYSQLISFGFKVLLENQESSADFKENPCLALICSYDEAYNNINGNYVTLSFKNCKDEIVYYNKATRFISTNDATYYQYTTKDALRPIKKIKYSYIGTVINPQFWTIDTQFKSTLKRLKFVN